MFVVILFFRKKNQIKLPFVLRPLLRAQVSLQGEPRRYVQSCKKNRAGRKYYDPCALCSYERCACAQASQALSTNARFRLPWHKSLQTERAWHALPSQFCTCPFDRCPQRRRKRRDEKKKGQVERYMTLRVRFYLWIVGPQGGSQAASENNFNTISLAGISFLY